VAGDPQARTRLDLPVSQAFYDAVVAMPPAEQARFTTMLMFALHNALEEWRTLREIEELTTATRVAPAPLSPGDGDVPLY
jgi:hypothetical protein